MEYQYKLNVMSVCILALFIQHAKRIRHIILPFVTWQTVPHYLINGTIFGKVKAQITFWFSLQVGLKHFKYIQLHIVITVQRLSWKVRLFCEFLFKLNFLYWHSKIAQKPKVMNGQTFGTGSFLQDGKTWRNQYSFLSILHSRLKGTYTKLHTQHPYKVPLRS